jgi:hypothetical protein
MLKRKYCLKTLLKRRGDGQKTKYTVLGLYTRRSFVLLVCFAVQLYNWIVEGQRALTKSNYF